MCGVSRLLSTEEALIARGETVMGPGGRRMSRTELGVRLDEAEGVGRRPFDATKHPRHPAGTPVGGRFRVKENAEGRFEVINPNGKKVAETTEEGPAQEFAAKANEADKALTIPGGVTTQDIPNAWAVEQGYASYVDSPGTRSMYGQWRTTYPGEIHWKPGVNPEEVLVHYLSGTKPENFEVGTQAWEQWMYGRNPRAPVELTDYGTKGISTTRDYEYRERRKIERAAQAKIKKPKGKAEQAFLIRRLTAALAAAGFRVAGDEPEEALVAALELELDAIQDQRFVDDTVALMMEPLTAAVSIPVAPPRKFFEPPTGRPGPYKITADGRISGWLALWDSCHMGEPGGAGVCVAPPRSGTGYSLFHLGEIETAEGDLVPTGKITLGTGHASLQASRNAAAAHYDNTGTVVADVRVGEDGHGIWFSGALRPGTTPEQVRALRAASLSGDWRRYRNALELVAALAVNVPGFPIPRVAALVAPELDGDERLSLVAAGAIVEPIPMAPGEVDARIEALGLLAGVIEL
jgi:hypothetical protein